MIIKKKKKIILITLVIVLFIIAITLLVLNQTGVINTIIENINKEEIKKEISYEVYKHVNGQTAMLLVAEDTENGIEKIIYPNNEMELYCNGKTKVAFDYNTDITGKESLTFKLVNTLGEEIEKTIKINDQFYLDMINHSITKETETQKVLTVNYKEGSSTKQYKIGDTSNWVNYTNTIRLDDYQILEALGNESREVKVSLRQIDNIGNEIIVLIKYIIPNSITYKQEDTVIEGESILACVENNNLESGNYIFKVTGTVQEQNEQGVLETKTETLEYPVELYNYNEDANYIGQNYTLVGNTAYIGMGKANSEKRMLILKYNKNLTISEGITITPTGTNESINGATYLCTKKGMFIYCAGTLTNNGTITMTAKGTVNQEGEDVYLYKNEDNTYEYIPEVGVTGASGISKYGGIRFRGKSPSIATDRKTGGGGSGGLYNAYFNVTAVSGNGGAGTSYSGGSGGGSGNGLTRGSSGSSAGGYGGSGYVGGAGNPGRNGGQTGTGGLLIICANTIKNNAVISSNGSSTIYGYESSGGGSGGGSINIFYKSSMLKGVISVTGGAGGQSKNSNERGGGAGGTGCTTIGNISTGTFVKDE